MGFMHRARGSIRARLFALACLLVAAAVPGVATAQFVLGAQGRTYEVSGVTQLDFVSGWPDTCTPTTSTVTRTGNVFDVVVDRPVIPPDILCFSAFMGFRQVVPLGVLPPQQYTVRIYNWCCTGPPLLAQEFVFVPSGVAASATPVPATGPYGKVALVLALLALAATRLRYRPAP